MNLGGLIKVRSRAMTKRRTNKRQEPIAEPDHEVLDFVWSVWAGLEPAERLRRSWALRLRLPDRKAVHDAKLFPQP